MSQRKIKLNRTLTRKREFLSLLQDLKESKKIMSEGLTKGRQPRFFIVIDDDDHFLFDGFGDIIKFKSHDEAFCYCLEEYDDEVEHLFFQPIF